jgi:hypothetical protein
MKRFNSLIAAALTALVLSAGCSNVLHGKVDQNAPAAGKGTVRVQLGRSGRTVLPDTAQLYYALVFTTGTKTETAAIRAGETAGTVILDPGTWNLEAKGYLSADDAADFPETFVVSGTTAVTVVSGQTTPVTVELSPREADAGFGELDYTISFPNGLDTALLKLTPITGAGTPEDIDLSDGELEEGVITKADTLNLEAGYYRLSLQFSCYDSADVVTRNAAKTLVFHIYDGLTTEVSETFGDEDFTELPTFSSIEDLAAYLQNAAPRPRDNPYAAALRDVSLTGVTDPMGQIFAALGTKYVALDLSGCTGLTIASTTAVTANGQPARGTLVSLILPDTVETIGNYAFYNCASLKSVQLPAALASIGNYAFQNCSALASVELPAALTSIGSYTFQNCSALSRLDLPEDLKTIGAYAFSGCRSLISFRLPPKLLSIAATALQNNAQLLSVEIPNISNFTGANPQLFSGCTNLSLSLYSSGEVSGPLELIADGKALIENDTLIIALASLTGELAIPAHIKTIGPNAFLPSQVTAVIWPSAPAAAAIGNNNFLSMPALESVVLPPTLTTVGTSAFSGCTNLASVVMPSAASLGGGVFNNCTALASINSTPELVNANPGLCKLPANLAAIPGQAFSNVQFTSVDMGECSTVNEITESSFSNASRLAAVTLPPNLEVLSGAGYIPFSNCPLLTSLTLPASLKILGQVGTPALMASLAANLPNGLTTVGQSAFYNCAALTSITLPSGVTTIGQSAFYNCAALASITIPDGVTTIGMNTFYGCAALASITLPSGVTTIDGSAFYNCAALTSIALPAGLTTIEGIAFANCAALTSIDLPSGVTTIGNGAFHGATSLVYVKWPVSAADASIDSTAFNGCTALKYVQLPNNLTSIAANAFYGTSSLFNPNANCDALELVIVENASTVPAIQAASFPTTTNPSLKFYVPDAKVSEYKAAANWSGFAAAIDSQNNLSTQDQPENWTAP